MFWVLLEMLLLGSIFFFFSQTSIFFIYKSLCYIYHKRLILTQSAIRAIERKQLSTQTNFCCIYWFLRTNMQVGWSAALPLRKLKLGTPEQSTDQDIIPWITFCLVFKGIKHTQQQFGSTKCASSGTLPGTEMHLRHLEAPFLQPSIPCSMYHIRNM